MPRSPHPRVRWAARPSHPKRSRRGPRSPSLTAVYNPEPPLRPLGVGSTAVLLAIWNVSADAAVVGIGVGAAAVTAAVTAQYRLRAQLNHDTEIRERDATRDALDSVVIEITNAAGPMNAASAAFRELFKVRSASLKTATDFGLDAAEDEARLTVERLRDLRVALIAASFRLHLRFPDADPIIGRLAEWRETFVQLAEDYQAALDSADVEMAKRFDAATATATCLGQRLNAFLEVARAWASNPSK